MWPAAQGLSSYLQTRAPKVLSRGAAAAVTVPTRVTEFESLQLKLYMEPSKISHTMVDPATLGNELSVNAVTKGR